MAWITAENKDVWHYIAKAAAPQRPIVGRVVTITTGKHAGTKGTVTWHGPDPYASTRYLDSAMLALRQIHGREGYRIRVQPANGAAFFCKAQYATVEERATNA